MARPLRIEYPDAHYHVINRGNRREKIFTDDSACRLFLDKLSEFSELYDIVIHCYCLMPNHFHLQLRTRHANLGKFMQSLLTSFTISMNRMHHNSGHLFQGRYKAHLVESELYRNKLSRYIHLNPVKIKSLEGQPLSEIRKYLHDYRWSSFRSYIGIEKKPKWLERNHVLASWGNSASEKMANYRKYVEEGIATNNLEEISTGEITNIIGSDSFKDRIVKKYLVRDLSDIDEREQSVLRMLNAPSVEDVLDIVSAYFKIGNLEEITCRRGCNPDARKSAMYLAGKHCRKRETLTSIAKTFRLKISGLNMARNNLEIDLKSNKILNRKIMDMEKILNDKNIKMDSAEKR